MPGRRQFLATAAASAGAALTNRAFATSPIARIRQKHTDRSEPGSPMRSMSR